MLITKQGETKQGVYSVRVCGNSILVIQFFCKRKAAQK